MNILVEANTSIRGDTGDTEDTSDREDKGDTKDSADWADRSKSFNKSLVEMLAHLKTII